MHGRTAPLGDDRRRCEQAIAESGIQSEGRASRQSEVGQRLDTTLSVETGLALSQSRQETRQAASVREITCRIDPYTHGNLHSAGREECRNTGKAPPTGPPAAVCFALLGPVSCVGCAYGAGWAAGCRPGSADPPDFRSGIESWIPRKNHPAIQAL